MSSLLLFPLSPSQNGRRVMTGRRNSLPLFILVLCVALLAANILLFHCSIASVTISVDPEFMFRHNSSSSPSSSSRSSRSSPPLPSPRPSPDPTRVEQAFEYLKSQLPKEYHPLILPSARAAVQPLWTCRDVSNGKLHQSLPPRTVNKFMFVHVFKTAGSTMRRFFHDYAARCPSRSYATLTSCTALLLQRANTDNWSPCLLKDGSHNGKFRYINRSPVQKEDLHTFDMIGGHFRIGLMNHLRKYPEKPNSATTNHRYLVFARNAALKYVSGKVYIKQGHAQNLTAQFIIHDLQREVRHRKKYHCKYASYLLTPTQEDERKRMKWNYAQSTRVIMQNMVDFNVTIGLTDDMRSSINILESIMDPLGHIKDLFVGYGGRNANETKVKKHNISPLSSESILEVIRREYPTTFEDLMEFVKYEQQVTDFAVAFQQLQLQAIGGRMRSQTVLVP